MFVALLVVGWGEEAQEEAPFAIKPGENFTIPDLGLEMLWGRPDTFTMGSPPREEGRHYSDEEQHQVTLTNGFYLGKHEVTQAQWQRVMGSNPSMFFKGADRPVEQVSRNDVTSFCKKLTEIERRVGRLPAGMAYQLPTEAEWEYACRAGTTTAYSFGGVSGELYRHANYADLNTDFSWSDKARDDGFENTSPVDNYPANAWGFYDMHGNIWEWCADWYGDYPSGAVRGVNRLVRRSARTASNAAVLGSARRTTPVARIGAGANPPSASTTWASASVSNRPASKPRMWLGALAQGGAGPIQASEAHIAK